MPEEEFLGQLEDLEDLKFLEVIPSTPFSGGKVMGKTKPLPIPKWFSLEKYEPTQNFTLENWYWQFEQRRIALTHFRWGTPYEFFLKKIQESPIIDFPPKWKESRKQMRSIMQNISIVQTLGQYYAWANVRTIPDRYIREFEKLSDKRKDGRPFNAGDMDFMRTPIRNGPGVNITVDTRGTDEQIIEHFKVWLKDYREGRASQYSRKNCENWYKARVLPYIDLTIWALSEGGRISYSKMGYALFPDKSEGDPKEFIRKTTKVKAEEVMNNPFLEELHTQVSYSLYPSLKGGKKKSSKS